MTRLVVAVTAALALVQPVSGSDIWPRLHRPLHLPRLAHGAACPVSKVGRRVNWRATHIFGGSGIGPGPVYPGLGSSGGYANVTQDTQYGGPWLGGKVFWYVLPSYRGPVLLRGRQLDGPHIMGFNGRKRPNRELQIGPSDSVGWDGQPAGSRGVPSGIRVLTGGCYGVQIDGTRFSRVVVFEVVY